MLPISYIMLCVSYSHSLYLILLSDCTIIDHCVVIRLLI
jgi:hypothetical protein